RPARKGDPPPAVDAAHAERVRCDRARPGRDGPPEDRRPALAPRSDAARRAARAVRVPGRPRSGATRAAALPRGDAARGPRRPDAPRTHPRPAAGVLRLAPGGSALVRRRERCDARRARGARAAAPDAPADHVPSRLPRTVDGEPALRGDCAAAARTGGDRRAPP